MIGKVLQLNLSPGGLPKRPTAQARLTRTGLEGDSCRNTRYHGGPLQALLLIASETVNELRALGYPVYYGALGENITMEGIQPATLRAGQRYRIGEVIIELTKPRQPCHSLDVYGPAIKQELYDQDVKAGDPRSPRWAKGGFYASVVQTGEIRQGDIIALVDQAV